MKNIFQSILATIAFITITFIGLVLAFTFIFTILIGAAVLYIVNRIRGKSFSARQFWQEQRQRAGKKTQDFTARYRYKYSGRSDNFTRSPESEVTDVEFREIR
ncbi:hypothetical protein AAEX37_02335 [Oligella sp. MSHR50489EDL]|uniref:hypothetical protein n=1 Tax=Oligella sp. MSHR50489EDL TaxID=3139409 RepID=UPI003D81C24F